MLVDEGGPENLRVDVSEPSSGRVNGQRAIAKALHRSERWLRDVLSTWPKDRQPPIHTDYAGRQWAFAHELRAWEDRQRAAPRRARRSGWEVGRAAS
jgi:hypothetical protein